MGGESSKTHDIWDMPYTSSGKLLEYSALIVAAQMLGQLDRLATELGPTKVATFILTSDDGGMSIIGAKGDTLSMIFAAGMTGKSWPIVAERITQRVAPMCMVFVSRKGHSECISYHS